MVLPLRGGGRVDRRQPLLQTPASYQEAGVFVCPPDALPPESQPALAKRPVLVNLVSSRKMRRRRCTQFCALA
jgi:hypothetical protein